MNVITLIRDTFNKGETFGKMFIEDRFICHTIERPWLNNESGISCIPEGTYLLKLRFSPVVKKSSGGKYSEGYEITSVPNRTFIMVHPANFSSQLRGCISTGEGRGMINGVPAVLNSRKAFDTFMEEMEKGNDWEIVIKNQ